jgi:hypothetical protein
MNNKLWFGCPKCFLAFYTKGEYEHHHYEAMIRG